MEINTADSFVMEATVVFGWVVSEIVEPWLPVNIEHTLADSVTQPVESHVHGFGLLLLDGVVGNAHCGGIVCLDGGGSLGLVHFLEGGADGDCFLAIEEDGCNFSFGS